MIEKITDKHNAQHYLWGDNCQSWVLADTKGLSVKQESMPPTTREKLHYHSHSQQFFFILKGTATFYTGNEKSVVREQQGLLIDPETPHYIANESSDVLEFIVISQPTTDNDRTTIDEETEKIV